MLIDYNELDNLKRYKIMSDTVVPRPIAWIVTENKGVINAAPFSYFIPLSSEPATLLISIGHKDDGTKKDTLANILSTKKATICFVGIENIEDVKKCSTSLKKEESEIEKYGIKTKKILDGFPPMIENSKSAMFCEYYKTVALPGETIPVIVEIKKQYLDDGMLDEKFHVNMDNIGRSGIFFKKMSNI